MSEVYIDGIRYLPQRDKASIQVPFDELILYTRRLKNETLQQAADGIGTTKSHLWTLENGGSMPRLPMLSKVLKYYGLSFDEIAITEQQPEG